MIFAHLLSLAVFLVTVTAEDGFVKMDFNVLKGTSYEAAFAKFIEKSSTDGLDKALDLLNGDPLEKRDGLVSLVNQKIFYTAALDIGSNSSTVQVLLDTGSSDLWVTGSGNPHCTSNGGTINCDQYGTFNMNASTTFINNNTDFSIKYSDKTSATGTWGSDSISLSSSLKLDRANFAVASVSNSTVGVFGIGFTGLETLSNKYVNVPEAMKLEGLIKKNAYSLYLTSQTSATGSILFGGIDHAKYSGDLSVVDIVQTNGAYLYVQIPLSSVTVNLVQNTTGTTNAKREAKLDISAKVNISNKKVSAISSSSWTSGAVCSTNFAKNYNSSYPASLPTSVDLPTFYVATTLVHSTTTSLGHYSTTTSLVEASTVALEEEEEASTPAAVAWTPASTWTPSEPITWSPTGPIAWTPASTWTPSEPITWSATGPVAWTPDSTWTPSEPITWSPTGPIAWTPDSTWTPSEPITWSPTGTIAWTPATASAQAISESATAVASSTALVSPSIVSPPTTSIATSTISNTPSVAATSVVSEALSAVPISSLATSETSLVVPSVATPSSTSVTSSETTSSSESSAIKSSVSPVTVSSVASAATSSTVASSTISSSSQFPSSSVVSSSITSSSSSSTSSTIASITSSSSSSSTISSSTTSSSRISSTTSAASSRASSSSAITSSSVTSSSATLSSSSASSSSASATPSASSVSSKFDAGIDILFDSGTTLTVLPADIVTKIINLVAPNSTIDSSIGGYRVPCSIATTGSSITYNFDNKKDIKVPLSDLTLQIGTNSTTGDGICMFGILPGESATLGDNFLRSAYTVINLDDKTVSLAQVHYTDDQTIEVIQ